MGQRKSKRKGVTEKLLLLVSDCLGVTDSFLEIFLSASLFYQRARWHQFQKRKLQGDLWRLKKFGYLERITEKGEAKFKLTEKGRDKLVGLYPVALLANRDWDGKWRLVIFDIAEVKRNRRDRLRKSLRRLGLGMMQESVWVTPYDLGESLRSTLLKEGFREEVIVLEAVRLFGEDEKNLALKIWGLEELNQDYQEWLVRAERFDFPREELINQFLEILKKDPILPKNLLPENWTGEKARAKFLDLFQKTKSR